jgi:hypothetical protein
LPKKMNLQKATFSSMSVILFASASAYAGSVTFSETIASLPNDSDTTINILKFDTANDIDPAGGGWNSTVGATLDQVTVTVTISLANGSVQMDNDDATGSTGTAEISNTVNSFTHTGVFAVPFSALDLQASDTQDFALDPTTGDALGYTNTGLGDWAIYDPVAPAEGIGTGSYPGATASALGYTTTTLDESIAFTVNTRYRTSAAFSGSNGFFQGNTPDASYTVEVTYNYTPVPEPSTFAVLVGMGALAFVAARRRR